MSQTGAFEVLGARLGLGPKSRAAYVAIDLGLREPTDAEQRVLAEWLGGYPADVAEPDTNGATPEVPGLADLIGSISALVGARTRAKGDSRPVRGNGSTGDGRAVGMAGGTKTPANPRVGRLICFTIASVILFLAAFRVYATFTAPWWHDLIGNDFLHYLDAIRRWFQTGSPYIASEVAGPFAYTERSFLHPPISIALFGPFLVIPWPLWWVIPLTIFAYSVFAWKPAAWTWPLMALPLVIYPVGAILVNGNSDMWMWAFFAAGLRWGWPAALMILKPSVAIFALVGVGSRRWWIIILGFALYSVALLPWWIEWVRVVLNSPGSLLYSAGNVWIFAIPLIARLGRTDGPDRAWVPLGHRLGLAVGRWEDRARDLRALARGRGDRGDDRRPV